MISDIHGNHMALQKVLEDVGNGNRAFVCLGDVAWGGPQPSEVLRELRRLSCPIVMGNTDEFLIGRRKERLRGRWKDLELWCREALTDEDRDFIRGFKPTITFNLNGGLKLLCYHGSPRSNREAIYSTTADAKLGRICRGHPEKVLAGGHTHSQMVRRFGDKLIINPGSVGQPFEYKGKAAVSILPRAEYATVDYGGGKLSMNLKRVRYDMDELKPVVARSDMPHKDWWMKFWKQ